MNQLISVVMITFNHERYIAAAIDSILNQSYKNFELIIVNDGSVDSTVDIINSYTDSRIKYIYQENSGPSSAINSGLEAAFGEYIALFSGDDISNSNRLEKQLNAAMGGSEEILFFSEVQFIDSDGHEIVDNAFCEELFDFSDYNRIQALQKLFTCGNYFCAPSAFFSKRIVTKTGQFNPVLLQLQDYDYWIRALVNGSGISIIHELLVKYRVQANSKNLSGLKPGSIIRTEFEFPIALSGFNNLSLADFNLMFARSVVKVLGDIPLALAVKSVSMPHRAWRLFGLQEMSRILQSGRSDLVSYPDFYAMVENLDVYRKIYSQCVLVLGGGESDVRLYKAISPEIEYHEIVFHLSKLCREIESLKFIPFLCGWGEIELLDVTYEYEDRKNSVLLSSIRSDVQLSSDGVNRFNKPGLGFNFPCPESRLVVVRVQAKFRVFSQLELAHHASHLENSISWKMTKPFRFFKKVLRIRK